MDWSYTKENFSAIATGKGEKETVKEGWQIVRHGGGRP